MLLLLHTRGSLRISYWPLQSMCFFLAPGDAYQGPRQADCGWDCALQADGRLAATIAHPDEPAGRHDQEDRHEDPEGRQEGTVFSICKPQGLA